jgi:hypothetical protein
MLRRSVAPATSRAVGFQQRQVFTGGAIMWNLGNHFAQIASVPAASMVLSSPIGTTALVVLNYNVAVIGLKHCQYTLELFLKDYFQDAITYTVLRYLIYITLIISVSHVFCEI